MKKKSLVAEVGIEKCDHFIPIGKTIGFIDLAGRGKGERILNEVSVILMESYRIKINLCGGYDNLIIIRILAT